MNLEQRLEQCLEKRLEEHLRELAAAEPLSTDDVLATFLPLAREVVEAHRAGLVAPLEGLADLRVDEGRIWFESIKRREPRESGEAIVRLEQASLARLDVVEETRRADDGPDGDARWTSSELGTRGEPVVRPVFLPGYVAWEHELGHHDPLTDIHSLGLILASLACGLNLCEPRDLELFVTHRRNLFALRPQLNPVLARAILNTTELDRRRRVQDLPALLHALANYREQQLDFEIDLARTPGFRARDPKTKQDVVLTKLRDRLFDVSRRNSLLHFRATGGSVNLTQASIPLMVNLSAIREDQLLVADERLVRQIVVSDPIPLNKYLNFSEAIYLPSLLERIIGDARRDQQEYGCAQLRLVLCFLSWTNLKEQPVERFVSPLVLVPVRLTKSKGIRDTYLLDPLTAEAEINPVLRHQFRQLYNITLPETIDLSTASLDSLYEFIAERVRASEPGVSVEKLSKPRIDLIHDRAQRRVEQYRRTARLSGRGVRSYLNTDYSYDRANFHPLGVQLFSTLVRTPECRLRAFVEDQPRPPSYVVPAEPEPQSPSQNAPQDTSQDAQQNSPQNAPAPPDSDVIERTFYQVRDSSDDNPYVWNFDLCNVTLANFHYRRMSLVRDYEAIQERALVNEAFDATFSLSPRPVRLELPEAPPLAERFDVVPCDPTQATAIAEARRGASYLIQGPPGTGKSQTITNLIADYVARGLRVLFVCEKRAAIDVVFARLKQTGLGTLGCLIHDSQTDKKEFILDLKQTYETLLAETARDASVRETVVKSLTTSLAPLERFDEAMQAAPESCGIPTRELIERCLRVAERHPSERGPDERDSDAAEPIEGLPDYRDWDGNQPLLDELQATIADIEPSGVWARHPLRFVSPRLSQAERPSETLRAAVDEAIELLRRLREAAATSDFGDEPWLSLERTDATLAHLSALEPFAVRNQLELLDSRSTQARSFARSLGVIQTRADELAAARKGTEHWIVKLSPVDTAAALEQARALEQRTFGWLSLGWWRLRSVLNRSYRFAAHAVRPTWSQVLAALEREHDAESQHAHAVQELTHTFQLDRSPEEARRELQAMRETIAALPSWLASLHRQIVGDPNAAQRIARGLVASHFARDLRARLDAVAIAFDSTPLERLARDLDQMRASLRQLPRALEVVGRVSALPDRVQRTLRERPWTIPQAEAAVTLGGWSALCNQDRELRNFNGAAQSRLVSQLHSRYDAWLAANADEVLRRVKERFLANVHSASQPASRLTLEAREQAKRYNQGRRILEHEFGKSMRYKAIRELVDGDSGLVVRDLKPIWLMSPLSVSDTLPLVDSFDVVIFDEASQVTLEESAPAIFRGRQVIVVGDEMQLPPTEFFASKQRDDDDADELFVEEAGERIRYDLQSDSFLSHAAKNLPSTMLGWHYRSRSESLISFSNWAFYDGRLLTVPDCQPPSSGSQRQDRSGASATGETVASGTNTNGNGASGAVASSPGASALDRLLATPLSFHHLPSGVYESRRNRAEAEYIATLLSELLKRRLGLSVAVIAFSEAQQDEIESALGRLADADDEFRALYEEELTREVDGQHVGLLVKNLENIQGDERDVVILSICFGPGPTGKMLMNFGPINKSGGEKRLNVAFSRAKQRMAVVSSIQHGQITNDYNQGAACLKNYLKYAEAVSRGDLSAARRVLDASTRWRSDATPGDAIRGEPSRSETNRGESSSSRSGSQIDVVSEQLRDELVRLGWVVDCAVGQSHFRVDLAVRRAGEERYRLGILVDTLAAYESSTPLERDFMRPRLLRNFGWNVHVLLAKDWLDSRAEALARIETLLAE